MTARTIVIELALTGFASLLVASSGLAETRLISVPNGVAVPAAAPRLLATSMATCTITATGRAPTSTRMRITTTASTTRIRATRRGGSLLMRMTTAAPPTRRASARRG